MYGISLKEKSYFFHLLAVMVGSGVPLIASLQTLSRRTNHATFQRVIAHAAEMISSGSSFSDALARAPDTFSEFEIGFIKSGESVGQLETVLKRLAEELDQSYEIRLKIITASIYPLMVLATLVIVAIGMVMFLVPTLESALISSGLQPESLPFATKILIGARTVITSYWWAIILFVLAFAAFFSLYRQSEEGRYRLDMLKLNFPLIGDLIKKAMCLKFIRLLSLLLDAGFPVLSTLKMAAETIPNEAYKLKLWEVTSRVQAGEKISAHLQSKEKLFPEELIQMMAIGEKTASLAETSKKIAVQYEREIAHALKRMTAVFEPLMILLVGLFVGVIALAVLMPIFSITQRI